VDTTSNIWWIGPLVLVLMRVVVFNARLSGAERDGRALVFRVAPSFRYMAWLGVLIFTVLFIRAIGREEPWVLALAGVAALLFSLAWPPTFVCTPTSLIRYLWWKPQVAFSWDEVTQIEHTKGGDLNIYDSSGRCLCFTRFHVDPIRFKSEVLRRANIKASIESSQPISLR
jgi:hypothetical protein